MAVISMKALLETGVHFGHRTHKWSPLMKPYIFTERNGIHIIDLQQTLTSLENVYKLVRATVAGGGTVMFVGTKRQAQEAIAKEAERCGMPYVNQRWLGGTLTNWKTIKERLAELKRLEEQREAGEFERLTKKEALILTRKILKLQDRLGGLRDMTKLPDLLFLVDVRREHTAIHEANILNLPVIALVDTNCDPRGVDYVIPANDDAIRAIKLLAAKIANAVLEGRALRKDEPAEEAGSEEALAERLAADTEEQAEEDLLGADTLAKIRGGELDFGEPAAQTDADASEDEPDDSGAERTSNEDEAEDAD